MPTTAATDGAALISEIAALSNQEIGQRLDALFTQKAAIEGAIVVLLGEATRRQTFSEDGATGPEPWAVQRFGISGPSARALQRVGEKAWDLPHLVGALCEGAITFDKMRAVADVATPETDGALREQAERCTVRQLVDVARTTAARRPSAAPTRSERDQRSLRFNDDCRTMTVQLPSESYAETKACIDARTKEIPSDGETPLDQRRCDAFLSLVRSTSSPSTAAHDATSSADVGSASPDSAGSTTTTPFFVVAHVPLDVLVDDAGDTTLLAGELERGGLLDGETVRRIACGATVAVAVDDDVGHTMYEGRAKRFATPSQRREVLRRDRHCRFPGCTNALFTNVHHVVQWKAGGRTDIDNLVVACEFHHVLVHSDGWSMTGDANEELTITAPTGRVMTSHPSPLWTRITDHRR